VPRLYIEILGITSGTQTKFETVIYGLEFQGTRTRERLRWQGPAAYTKGRPVLSSERAAARNNTVTVNNKYLVMIPRRVLDTKIY
jgi:hypothetical protein